MSYFEDASLVLIPSGIKDQKVYSIKPTDGSGDLTFSRASNATRVNSSGLVEKVRTNEALYSEDQTNWTDQNETSVTANTAANPLNGAVTADKVIPSVISTDHYRGLSMATLIGEFSVSIYVKADGYDFFDFGVYNSTALAYAARATFDLSTATYSLTSGTSASITSVGSGWYRVSMLASVASSSALSIYHRVRPTGGTGVYSGDGTSGMLLWGCQLENGVMTDYVGPTTSAAVSVGPVSGLPRLDYSGGASCPSLLLEPQRTNSATNNESLASGTFSYVDGVTFTANSITAPTGYTQGCKFEKTGSGVADRYDALGGGPMSQSIFVKAGTSSRIVLSIDGNVTGSVVFDLSTLGITNNGTATGKIVDFGNGWYRCIANYSATPTSGPITRVYLPDTGYLYCYGYQMELNASYETSLIPTLSSAVTRVADDCRKTSIASLIGQTEGTIFVEFEHNGIAKDHYSPIVSLQGTASPMELIEIYAGPNTLYYSCVMQDGGVTQLNQAFTPSVGTNKLAFAYGLNNSVLYLNGSIVGAVDTFCTIPTLYNFALGAFTYSTAYYYGEGINQALLFTSRLSNADLATLTA